MSNNTLTTTDFFDIVRDVELDPALPGSWQRRSIAWAEFVDRQRAAGYSITIGPPA